jgi:hypothetical protein
MHVKCPVHVLTAHMLVVCCRVVGISLGRAYPLPGRGDRLDALRRDESRGIWGKRADLEREAGTELVDGLPRGETSFVGVQTSQVEVELTDCAVVRVLASAVVCLTVKGEFGRKPYIVDRGEGDNDQAVRLPKRLAIRGQTGQIRNLKRSPTKRRPNP